MSEIKQLREVINDFTDDVRVSDVYFDMMLFTWRRMSERDTGWDEVKAAAVLLNILYRDGLIHHDQINAEGYHFMRWAEEYLEDTDVVTFIGQFKAAHPVRLQQ